jgi:hypothetical protein
MLSKLHIYPDKDGHENHLMGTGGSSCFYDSPIDITLFLQLNSCHNRFEIRTARIEVSDQKGELHAHAGYTLGYIASGSGYIRTHEGKRPVRCGDRFSFGPGAPHISVADPNRTMIEIITYLGSAGDCQELREIGANDLAKPH